MATIERFEELDCWQAARVLTRRIYKISSSGRFSKDFALRDQMRRAAISIMSNIAEGFAVDHAKDGQDGLHLALTEPYDVAVVDLMLPKLDGLTLIEEVRKNNINTPVLILSAKRSVDDRVKGL